MVCWLACPEPERHLPQIACSLERVDRAGVAQDVRRHALVGDRRTLRSRLRHVLAQDVLEARSRHGRARRRDEQLRRGSVATDGEPRSDRVANLLPEQKGALLAPFAIQTHFDVAALEAHAIEAQADEFRDAEPSGDAKVEHRPITQPKPCRRVGCIENVSLRQSASRNSNRLEAG